jgi:hypothetical protein
MKQAKDALKKNNEDFAKMYVASASQKRSEGKFIFYQSSKLPKNCRQNGANVRSNQVNEKQ